MNPQRRSIFKWWAAWNDHRIEAWLEQMASDGWHLESVGALGPYRFVRGAPAQLAYRIDFWPNQGRDPSYEQLFRDAGWELASSTVGWSFWRHPYVDGQAPEIFTDNASKIAKYQRWLGMVTLMVVGQFALLGAAAMQPAGANERLVGMVLAGITGLLAIHFFTSLRARIKALTC